MCKALCIKVEDTCEPQLIQLVKSFRVVQTIRFAPYLHEYLVSFIGILTKGDPSWLSMHEWLFEPFGHERQGKITCILSNKGRHGVSESWMMCWIKGKTTLEENAKTNYTSTTAYRYHLAWNWNIPTESNPMTCTNTCRKISPTKVIILG